MITSIAEQLHKLNVKQEDSVYRNFPEEILNYPITVGDFFQTVAGEKTCEQFHLLSKAKEQEKKKRNENPKYQQLLKEKAALSKEMAAQKGSLSWEESMRLRQEKKQIADQICRTEETIIEQEEQENGFSWRNLSAILYKNTVCLTGMDDLKNCVPELGRTRLDAVNHIPFFTHNLERLKEAQQKGETIGIVGGPCLFGMDEVFMKVYMEDGAMYTFDCSCGRRCLTETKTEDTLEEFLTKNGSRVEHIEVDNRKSGITRQEYDSIEFVFAFAESLQAKAVIPLPDMSYFKYTKSDLAGLPGSYREQVLEEFKQECFQISDRYRKMIERIAQKYPTVEYQVFHARNEEMCELFYQKRAPYIRNSGYMQKITNVSGKKDAVIDYITMLALPYYLYGTKYVLQLDSSDETDSGRKCAKLHKKDMALTQILYPEYLSRDGENTIYCAPLQYKDYMNITEDRGKIDEL